MYYVIFDIDWVWDGKEFLQFSTQFSLVSAHTSLTLYNENASLLVLHAPIIYSNTNVYITQS